ncbi:NAD(P) transhydrogenase subunit alpha [Conexibacter sp. JD483]|uniref:NAD(P) transhydrogenase subunit alpha n=1 Tax=unclassified Conexibacter TaxID=2627773 RepID=UPI0027183F33|nr:MULTISPECIES: NAD(P) transhydrogenase subunit alpha [unclassified Conexibacter]MDO8187676.1 NAD(P) transhydrogenase subunit alpha [Conexibacter sp. CPCC 205706]MDO8199861.1 NAD(P) transhydrogenase subunit alpha [Conexibacter sp. CPCC 205762]MDR9370238.1 NAD(P) transhydrogenase subunit alpha [Conexibacter sp. JD483]
MEEARSGAARVGVPVERASGERRVALVPDSVKRLTGLGAQVVVEPGAGARARFSDQRYKEAGATLGDPWECDVVVKVASLAAEERDRLGPGQIVAGFLAPADEAAGMRQLADAGVTAYAMEAIPRTTRAQAMDALSSQSNLAGYKAALLAAEQLARVVPMLTTAAGTVPPASVLVLGAGVAGLQALATARRLGARTSAFDVRPEVAEQVESLGATWLDLGVRSEQQGGYARALDDADEARQRDALAAAIARFDAVITTALIPGRPAPLLVTRAAVEGMQPGSVVVDLAAERGGNCELSRLGEVVDHGGVAVVAPVNLAASVPMHASQLYARNVEALLGLVLDDAGALRDDLTDEILLAACVTADLELAR